MADAVGFAAQHSSQGDGCTDEAAGGAVRGAGPPGVTWEEEAPLGTGGRRGRTATQPSTVTHRLYAQSQGRLGAALAQVASTQTEDVRRGLIALSPPG